MHGHCAHDLAAAGITGTRTAQIKPANILAQSPGPREAPQLAKGLLAISGP